MMTTVLRKVEIDEQAFEFLSEVKGYAVRASGVVFRNVPDLVNALPNLRNKINRYALCEVSNFLIKGLEYRVIRNVTTFQSNYIRRLAREANDLDPSHRCLSDYGTFDLSGMHPPRLKGDTLTFFVEHMSTGLPYKVTVALSSEASPKVRYSLPPCQL